MEIFFTKNKYFFSIITGAIIIGGFLYFALKPVGVVVAPKTENRTTDNYSNIPRNNGIVANTVTSAGTCGASDNTIITKVIDGDTVVVEGGYHVRLLGMDADEKGYPCYDQAKNGLEKLVLGKQVVLEKDKTDLDQYGRCLRYIFIGNINVDVQLVKEGLAIARFYEPDTKYKTEISTAEIYAQQNKLGCKWGGAQQAK